MSKVTLAYVRGLERAIALLRELATCDCDEIYAGRKLHEPNAPHERVEDGIDLIQEEINGTTIDRSGNQGR